MFIICTGYFQCRGCITPVTTGWLYLKYTLPHSTKANCNYIKTSYNSIGAHGNVNEAFRIII